MILSFSIPLMRRSRRTMLPFHCVVPSGQSCGLLSGQGGRASAERPVAADRLQSTVGLTNQGGEKDKRFILFISFNTS
jgi:hypothetical protein